VRIRILGALPGEPDPERGLIRTIGTAAIAGGGATGPAPGRATR